MRSRTELVTTTFDLDSDEEDYSPDDDDSEEDWRPNKKSQLKQPRAMVNSSSSDAPVGRKRKAVASAASILKRRAISSKVNDLDFESDDDDDDDDAETEPSDEDSSDGTPTPSTSRRVFTPPPANKFVKTQLDLLLKKQDLLSKDWLENCRLSLWLKDEDANLLQKYLPVKTLRDEAKPREQQLQFTSTSVYSSWDEQHISDYIDVKVNCLDPNNRRIELIDLESLIKLSEELQEASDEDNQNVDDSDDENDENRPDLEAVYLDAEHEQEKDLHEHDELEILG